MDDSIEKTGKAILDSAFSIHMKFGSGLLEKAYRVILANDLRQKGHSVSEEVEGGFELDGIYYERMYRVDLLVDDAVIVELKSVPRIEPVFMKQCLTYMRFMDKKLGFVINFGMPLLKDGINRVINERK